MYFEAKQGHTWALKRIQKILNIQCAANVNSLSSMGIISSALMKKGLIIIAKLLRVKNITFVLEALQEEKDEVTPIIYDCKSFRNLQSF